MISLNGGYAMIKYNSTQEELQIAYRSKKPVLCYDENRRAHWAVIEETATESVDEETQEPITIYEYSYRLIDEVSGGEVHLYRHVICIETPVRGTLIIENSTNTPFTLSTLQKFLVNNGNTSFRKTYPFAGITETLPSFGLYAVSSVSTIWSLTSKSGDTIDINQIKEDIVTQIF